MNFIAKMELQYCGVSQCTFLYLGTGSSGERWISALALGAQRGRPPASSQLRSSSSSLPPPARGPRVRPTLPAESGEGGCAGTMSLLGSVTRWPA
jgi:hypothetical protein